MGELGQRAQQRVGIAVTNSVSSAVHLSDALGIGVEKAPAAADQLDPTVLGDTREPHTWQTPFVHKVRSAGSQSG